MRKKGTVLVVEDDPSVREALRLLLKHDFDILLAANLTEAVSTLRETTIDTVTLEPWLAGVQGRDLFEHIRRASPASRVIIVSGQRLSTWFDDHVREQVFDYLPKPFENRELLRAIERSVVRRRPALALLG